ncbi:MAG: hypothetical protein FWE35_13945 [Streptosporangiales bacterium]|nr:hypothetical protein [Streptosporangiales bacterium]
MTDAERREFAENYQKAHGQAEKPREQTPPPTADDVRERRRRASQPETGQHITHTDALPERLGASTESAEATLDLNDSDDKGPEDAEAADHLEIAEQAEAEIEADDQPAETAQPEKTDATDDSAEQAEKLDRAEQRIEKLEVRNDKQAERIEKLEDENDKLREQLREAREGKHANDDSPQDRSEDIKGERNDDAERGEDRDEPARRRRAGLPSSDAIGVLTNAVATSDAVATTAHILTTNEAGIIGAVAGLGGAAYMLIKKKLEARGNHENQ